MPHFPTAPPILSTPETHILDAALPPAAIRPQRATTTDLARIYEIDKTIANIRQGKWQRIALQFPDSMLPDAPRVFELLRDGLKLLSAPHQPLQAEAATVPKDDALVSNLDALALGEEPSARFAILADTSYGACCVDEIAAEHVDADVVVHYGRACLSPTARLPVIYVFTEQALDIGPFVAAFETSYPDLETKVILMADVIYSSHLPRVQEVLRVKGYQNLFLAELVHDPASALPNRTVPEEVRHDETLLMQWQLFHVSEPVKALLLTLSSRLASVRIFPTSAVEGSEAQSLVANTAMSLRRRYALLTSLSTVSIFGILINTLSVKNYLHIVEHVKARILAAGKKSYTFVVGKINAAKLANFSEIGGWVVIGCWESSLIESKDFWKPLITPFELEMALKSDGERIWTGEWRGDFQGILDEEARSPRRRVTSGASDELGDAVSSDKDGGDLDSELESTPPEFDLRAGRYISHSRPMRSQEAPVSGSEPQSNIGGNNPAVPSHSLIRRAKGDVAVIGGEISPGAEFLRSKRTWQGLGSDFEIAYDESGKEAGTAVEEGRSGIARGYTHGDDTRSS